MVLPYLPLFAVLALFGDKLVNYKETAAVVAFELP